MISDSTPNNTKILIDTIPFKNSNLFNYYLYPRKIYWFSRLSIEEAMEFAKKNNLDFVVAYNEDKRPIIRKIAK